MTDPTVLPPDSAPSYGRYRIERELGRGGMGVVYLASDDVLARQVALKVIAPEALLQPGRRERLQVEARATAKLRHANIVTLLELAFGPRGEPFLVMDFIPGESLKQRITRDGPLDPHEAATLTGLLARALAHAHGEGVLHRDVKPANVLLSQTGTPHLTDFGLAKEVDRRSLELTKSGQAIGTPAYMPPEQMDGDLKRIGPASDVYALGATLYETITGAPPFSGASPIEIVYAVLQKPPRRPSELRPDVPEDLERICLKCLEKEPADRYPSADALADDLARFRAGQTVEAARRGFGLVITIAVVMVVAAVSLAVGMGMRTTSPSESDPAASSPQDPDPDPVPEGSEPAGAPAWVRDSPLAERPPLPLPAGLTFHATEQAVVNAADQSLLVWHPPGTFLMGDPSSSLTKNGPQHKVELTRGFYLGKFEVSWKQYERFRLETNYRAPKDASGVPNHPVCGLTYADARAYCLWAGLRLPTEAEWEYAAGGRWGTVYPWGDEVPTLGSGRANLGKGYQSGDDRDGYLKTAPVTAFSKGDSPLGCRNLAGNVYEWTWDGFASYTSASVTDPRGEASDAKVVRGGGWNCDPGFVRRFQRDGWGPEQAQHHTGMRVCRWSQTLRPEWTVKVFPFTKTPNSSDWQQGMLKAITFQHPHLRLMFGRLGPSELRDAPPAILSANLPYDRFGIVATTSLELPKGRWEVVSLADDGVRIRVDDQLLVDDWTSHAPQFQSALFSTPRTRRVSVQVEYFEYGNTGLLITEIRRID